MKIFIEVETVDSADHMIGDYDKSIKGSKKEFEKRIRDSKIKIIDKNVKPSTILVDENNKEIGQVYPDELLDIQVFINFINQFKNDEKLFVSSVEYDISYRYVTVGIGFRVEIYKARESLLKNIENVIGGLIIISNSTEDEYENFIYNEYKEILRESNIIEYGDDLEYYLKDRASLPHEFGDEANEIFIKSLIEKINHATIETDIGNFIDNEYVSFIIQYEVSRATAL